jgi:hypothetical protein
VRSAMTKVALPKGTKSGPGGAESPLLANLKCRDGGCRNPQTANGAAREMATARGDPRQGRPR